VTNAEIIAAVQAAEAGKQIQRRHRVDHVQLGKIEWVDDNEPCWDFNHYEYRVKPEPLVCFCNFYADGSGACYVTKLNAVHDSMDNHVRIGVRMVETPE